MVCGNTYVPSRFLNVEDKRKELSQKPVLENFSTSASLHSLILDRQNHPNNALLSYLNINSLRYKITDLRILVPQFLPHYLLISETKLNKEFPNAQILISDYEIKSRRDRNKHGGGLLEFVRKGLICKTINSEIISLELTIKNKKWIVFSVYRPPKESNLITFFQDLTFLLNKHLSTYDNVVVMGDFNPLSAKFIKWSNTLKQIVGKLPTICLSVFDHFSGLAFKGLTLM